MSKEPLYSRIEKRLIVELERQKLSGKEFISDEEIDKLINGIIQELVDPKPIDLLTSEQRESMVITALEGGSNYWYLISDESWDLISTHKRTGRSFSESAWDAIKAGETLEIWDVEAEEAEENKLLGRINIESIRIGEKQMLKQSPSHMGNLLSGDWDAETADVWFQYCVLGSIIYG